MTGHSAEVFIDEAHQDAQAFSVMGGCASILRGGGGGGGSPAAGQPFMLCSSFFAVRIGM